MDFFVRVDYPPSRASIKVEDIKSTSLSSLKSQAGKAVKISEEDLKVYSLTSVAYARDVISLVPSDLKDNATLTDCGIVPNSTLFFSVPPDRNPKKLQKRALKAAKEKKEIEALVEKKLEVDTALKQFLAAKGKQRDQCSEYIEKHARKVFETKEFLKLSQDNLIHFLKKDSLNIKEGELFDDVLKWVKTKTTKDGKEASPDELKAAFKDILPHIRFPLLTTVELASKVVPLNLLPGDQVLALFTYIAQTEKKEKEGGKEEKRPDLPPALKEYRNVKRKATGVTLTRFDPTTAQNCTVGDNGKTVNRNSSYESSVRGDKPLEDEAMYEVSLTGDNQWSGSFVFGVIPRTSPVSQTCFTTEAWYFDMWHCHVRARSETQELPLLRGTDTQKQFSDNCEGRIMAMHFSAGSKGGGRLTFFLEKNPIPGAAVEIPSSYRTEDLVPFYGIYGRCRGARALE